MGTHTDDRFTRSNLAVNSLTASSPSARTFSTIGATWTQQVVHRGLAAHTAVSPCPRRDCARLRVSKVTASYAARTVLRIELKSMRGRARTDLSSAGPSFSTSYTRSVSAARAACAMTALRRVEGEVLVAR